MKILKYILSVIVFLGFEQITLSQYYLKVKSDSISLESDSVHLFIDEYRGAIDWQASSDLMNWVSLNTSKDTLGIRIDSSAYYRATIIEGTCNPVISDTAFLIEKLTITGNNQFIVDSLGGVFLLPTGIKVKIPKGAITEPKVIRLDTISCDSVNTLAVFNIAEKTSFLSGISIATDLFNFLKPIKIKIPLQDIDVKSLPMLYKLNSESKAWSFSYETMIVSPKDKFIEIILKGSGQKAIAQVTKSELFLNDVKSFLLIKNGDFFHNANPSCRDTSFEIIYKPYDTIQCVDCKENEGCFAIYAYMEMNYWVCNPPQRDIDLSLSLSPECMPNLIISPPGDLKIKKDTSQTISLTTEILKFPLSDQVIILGTSSNLSTNKTELTTDSYGNASFSAKGTHVGHGAISLSVSFKYYLTTLYVSGPAGMEYAVDDLKEKDIDATILVTVYDKPKVSTASATDIKCTSATIGGVVISNNYDEVTERGVYWGKYPNPEKTGKKEQSGSGEGTFSIPISSLDRNTTYYVNAYAKNSAGYGYGVQDSFSLRPKVKIMGSRKIDMHTTDSNTFRAELTNSLNQPIDGNIFWKVIPIESGFVGVFRDNSPTFYAHRKGEAFIVASATPVDNCNSLVTDTVRVNVTPECDTKPLQADCHSIWEGTVQIAVEHFQECYSSSPSVCNDNCLMRHFYTYDLTLTFEFEINATNSLSVGTLYVNGTEALNAINYNHWDGLCYANSSTFSMYQTRDLARPSDMDNLGQFFKSYNDFWSGFYAPSACFEVRGFINGNSGSITITSYNFITNGGVTISLTPVVTEVVLTKISE